MKLRIILHFSENHIIYNLLKHFSMSCRLYGFYSYLFIDYDLGTGGILKDKENKNWILRGKI